MRENSDEDVSAKHHFDVREVDQGVFQSRSDELVRVGGIAVIAVTPGLEILVVEEQGRVGSHN